MYISMLWMANFQKERSNLYLQKLIDCGGGGVHGDKCDGSWRVVVRKIEFVGDF